MNELTMNQQKSNAAWYKHFWPCFVIFLLTISVTSSLYFAYIAIKNADTVIDENYYQSGLDINQIIDAQEKNEQTLLQNAKP